MILSASGACYLQAVAPRAGHGAALQGKSPRTTGFPPPLAPQRIRTALVISGVRGTPLQRDYVFKPRRKNDPSTPSQVLNVVLIYCSLFPVRMRGQPTQLWPILLFL